ncbi:NAD-dependent DNA ligase LigA, partial [Myxococcota bacterium]|nr:NAD-dependent DNA ligase LigA [Myxococcota bacterium]
FLADPHNRAEIARFGELGLVLEAPAARPSPDEGGSEALAGLTFVLTGSLSRPRETFEQRIKAAGGRTSGSVSKKTSFVLAGEEAGSKLEKARALGVEILDEAGFEALFAARSAGRA